MAFATPFRITPSLGPDLTYAGAAPYNDANFGVISPPIGTKFTGNDGHTYVLLKAAGSISGAAQVTITDPAMTAVAGTGSAFFNGATAVTTGQYFWAKSTLQ